MRQQRAIETREKIFLATLDALAEKGVSAVTHRAIAEKAGVSLASTTYHFETKTDLLIKTFEWMVDQFEQSYRARLDNEQIKRLDGKRLINYLIDVYHTERALDVKGMVAWYEFVIEALRQPELQHAVRKWCRQTIDFYGALFEQAGIADPQVSANRYLDFIVGWDFFIVCRGQKKSNIQGYETLVRRLFSGLSKGGDQ